MEKRFLTVEEIAAYLGFSENTVRKWIRSGEIPFCRINHSIRFDKQVIEKWVQKGQGLCLNQS